MATTTLGIKFDIEDLDAAYEVVGTSDNYSFQYNLGVGSSLINNDRGSSNNTVRKTIPLKGNYGVFDVRVYAISNIGIRSEFIQERITISPPNFDGTFTFNNLRIAGLPPASQNNIIDVITPEEEGDLLVTQSEFLGKKSKIQWELIPPVGHAQEGSSLSSELLNDDFFDHFEVTIKRGVNGIVVGNSILNDSEALQVKLNSSEPAQALSFYRNFELDIDPASFIDLDLERVNSFEIVAYDSFGRTCTGILTGINYEPTINSFSHSMRGSSTSFSWSSVDNDFSFVKISGIAIPSEKNLFSSDSIHDNFYYYTNLKNASPWRNIPNKVYERNQTILHSDGLVYQARATHTASSSNSPANSNYWNQLEEPFDFKYIEETATENNHEQMQVFGYSYYYGFEANDSFGPGKNYNLTTTGLHEEGPLQDFTSLIRINNLRFRERDSDLIFDWDLVDNDGNSVDLSERKFIFTESDVPSLLGISGSLFDADTELFLSGITVGDEASSAALNDQGEKEKVEGLHNAKVFNNYEYTREINNAIYKAGGFPSDAYDFSSSTVYSPDSGPKNVTTNLGLFEIKSQNSISTPFIRPSYSDWDSARNYIYRSSTPHSDVVSYGGNVYKSTQNSGPEYTNGFFNEYDSYNSGDIITSPKSNVSIFEEDIRYEQDSVVLYSGEAYIALRSQSIGNAITPSIESDFWRVATEGVDYKDSVFKAKANISSPITIDPSIDSANWEEQTPEVSDKFQLQVSFYDEFANYNANDLVYSEDIVYKALQNNPTGQPIFATTDAGGVDDINYINSHWMPIWERDTKYDDIVFKHIGIPQSGKRSVGLEVAILDNYGEIIQKEKIIGQNYEPSILANGFNVDPFSEVTKVKFNFNYAFGAQESTTKVHLYRSTQPNFSIYDDRGFAIDKVGKINVGGQEIDSPLVKINLGAGDSTFGQNITTIVDSPPINDEITGYYYKILPFDAFGSGDVYNLENNQGALDLIKIYPKGYSSQDPSIPAGPISENILKNLVPGPVIDFSGDTAFENYFLNWAAPNYSVGRLDIVPDDVKYYEIWESEDDHLHFGTLNVNLTQASNTGFNRIGQELSSVGPIPPELQDPGSGITNATNILNSPAISQLSQITHKGGINDKRYFWVRPVDQVGNKGPFTGAANLSTDDVKGLELILGQAKTTDLADFEQNLTDSFPNVLALVPNDPFFDNYPSTNQISWDRHFVYYNGTGYVIGEGFADTDEPYVYWSATGKQATHGYDVTPLTSQQSGDLGLTGPGGGPLNSSISNPLRNILYSGNYNTSKYHPAGEGDTTELNGDPYNNNLKPSLLGEEHDFIIARNAAGTATPMWHAFANASIGTAHIREAAITSAKIHTLTADKIRSAEVRSQDIQVGGTGQIRSVGFSGLAPTSTGQQKGFAVSGDGSFVFAGDDGRLYFDNGVLTLAGKLRTEDDKEYTFPDMTAEPNSFFYVEQSDGTYIPEDDNDVCDIIARFQNSSIESDEVRFRADKVFVGGNIIPIFGYDDRDSNGKYDISGFTYDPSEDFTDGFVKQARAEFSVTGFDHIINSTLPNTCNSILISASGEKTSTERSISVNFIADGAASIYVELDAAQQVYKYNYDREFEDNNKTLSLKAVPYNTYGSLHYIFSTGKDLDNLVEIANQRNNSSYTINNLDQKFNDYDDTPFLAHVEISGVHNTQVIASDFVTIYGALPGKDSYTVFLDNENVSFPSDENNRVHGSDFKDFSTNAIFMKGYQTYEYLSGSNQTGTYSCKSIEKSDAGISYSATKNSSDQLNIELTNLPDYLTTGFLKITLQDNHYKAGSTRSDLGPIEFERLYTFSKIKEGSAGRNLTLTATDQTIEYNSLGINPTPSSVTVTASVENFYPNNGTSYPKFEFFSGNFNNKIQNKSTTSEYIHNDIPASYDSAHIPVTILCKAYDYDPVAGVEKLSATDQVTIFGLKEGSNGITILQTQEFANIPVKNTSSGAVTDYDYSNTENTISCFEGTNELTYRGTSSGTTPNSFYVTNRTLSSSIQGYTFQNINNKPVSNITAWKNIALTTGYIEYTIRTVDHDGGVRTFKIRQNITLTKDGAIARKVDLTASRQGIKYDTRGKRIGSQQVNFIANAFNQLTGTTNYYKWSISNTTVGSFTSSTSSNTATFTAPSDIFEPIKVKVEISEDGGTNILASDEVTIYAIQDGSDVITSILSNEAHSLTKSYNSVIDVSGSNTEIRVYQGSTELEFTTGTIANSRFKVEVVSKSAFIGNQTLSVSGKACSTSGIQSGVNFGSADSGFIKFKITAQNDEGYPTIIYKTQTFSLSKQGNKGVGVVYRGKWAANESYIGAEETSARGDVVYYNHNNSSYWIAIEDHTSTNNFVNDLNNGKWQDFEAEFKSVATDLLLANDVAITHSLSLGTSDPENPNVGSGGVIKSPPAKTFGDSTQGFILSNTKISNQDVTQFEVGDTNSHIKFDSSSERIELKGSLILNGIDATAGGSTVGFNSLDGTNATFIGGGYDNSITGYGGYHGLASAIIGGAYNDITGRFSTIGGGFDNNVGDNFSFIGGGFNNEMPQFVSGNAGANIIGAGVNNSIDGGSSQSIIAGKYNTIEYDPPAISFGSYIDTIYDSSQRKVILDSKRFPLSAYLFGRNGTDAVIASEASSSTYDYTINNSKFGAIVQISEKILRGDEILRSTPYSWMHIEYGFYNDVSLTLYVIPSFNEGSESNYWAFGLAPNTIYDGWIYISNSYSNQGHWIWSESRSWMFIWNQATYPDFAGKYYSNDTNTNNNISL
jgi:hypothetical protein